MNVDVSATKHEVLVGNVAYMGKTKRACQSEQSEYPPGVPQLIKAPIAALPFGKV